MLTDLNSVPMVTSTDRTAASDRRLGVGLDDEPLAATDECEQFLAGPAADGMAWSALLK